MTKYLILFGGLLFSLGCSQKESVTITIVDIGHLDRVGIARELSIINKYSPRVIGLDFLLTTDSLDKDIPLAEELSRTTKMIQATKLHNNDPIDITKWDSLEQYHPKFRFGNSGFTNMTITDDSVIVRELPMRQYYRDGTRLLFLNRLKIEFLTLIKPKTANEKDALYRSPGDWDSQRTNTTGSKSFGSMPQAWDQRGYVLQLA